MGDSKPPAPIYATDSKVDTQPLHGALTSQIRAGKRDFVMLYNYNDNMAVM